MKKYASLTINKTLSILIVFVVFASSAFAQNQKPNVIFMLVDNLGYGDLSCYNGGIRGDMRTPNIDSLAGRGMRLTQFLVEAGCTPSRAALLTGRYSIRVGLSMIIAPGGSNTLQQSEFTMGRLFQSVGYKTAYMGKWHLDAESKNQPQNQGFDEWRVGFSGSTDVTLYRDGMKQTHAPLELQKALQYSIVEADGPGEAKKIRPYDIEYRRQIEGDISKAAQKYVKDHSVQKAPFFLMIGWTRPHYPNLVAPEFVGKSGIGQYGDSVDELDGRVGEVLAAVKAAGIENNTIIVFASDNGPTTTGTIPEELYAGSAGPFRGELGDAYEGSIRTAAMVVWPGHIKPGISNEMFAINDFLPTFSAITGGKLPTDRIIDGIDQSAFLLGKQSNSNRDHFLTFIGDRLAAVRWRQWRIYPMEFQSTNGNPALGGYVGTMKETAGYPEAYNIEADQREQVNQIHINGWLVVPYLKLINEYRESVKKYPNPPAPNLVNIH